MLTARGLAKTYASEARPVHALRGVDLQIHAGEFVAIMGPSGCGKSTLLHMLGGLDTPTAGEVLVDGTPVHDLSEQELTLFRRRRVGFVFQFFNLVPVLTAAENVGLPCVIDGKPNPGRVAEVLSLVGIPEELAGKVPSQLSGGEQQRVAIARAIVNSPTAVLADEPTGNLDLRSGRQIMGLFADLNERGQTVVIVTHDPNVAAMARRVVFLRDGVVADETTQATDAALLIQRLLALDEPESV